VIEKRSLKSQLIKIGATYIRRILEVKAPDGWASSAHAFPSGILQITKSRRARREVLSIVEDVYRKRNEALRRRHFAPPGGAAPSMAMP